jgi:hypothetical protein
MSKNWAYEPETSKIDRAELLAAIPAEEHETMRAVFRDLDRAESLVQQHAETNQRLTLKLHELVEELKRIEDDFETGGCAHDRVDWDFSKSYPIRRCMECGKTVA